MKYIDYTNIGYYNDKENISGLNAFILSYTQYYKQKKEARNKISSLKDILEFYKKINSEDIYRLISESKYQHYNKRYLFLHFEGLNIIL